MDEPLVGEVDGVGVAEPWWIAAGVSAPPDEPEVLISAIEHYSYCPRQCALIHVEQTFEENIYTVRGRLAHERVDTGDDTRARGVRVARGIPLWSARLGLRGRADLVEFLAEGPYPVEYKSGRRRSEHADLRHWGDCSASGHRSNPPARVS